MSPTEKLEVNGNAKIEGEINIDNTLTLSDTGTFAQIAGSKPMRITGQSIELNTGIVKLSTSRVEIGSISGPNNEQLAVSGRAYFGISVEAGNEFILTDTQNTNRYKLTIVNGVLTTTLIP